MSPKYGYVDGVDLTLTLTLSVYPSGTWSQLMVKFIH
jgi:hypothetical protein